MDKEIIKQALQTFCDNLAEKPVWAILIRRNGELLARVGDNAYVDPWALDYDLMARLTQSHSLHEVDFLDKTRMEDFEFSINAGRVGVYIVVNLLDAYFVGISYKNIGIRSYDAVIDSIHEHFYALLEAINPPSLE
jgi:hypothetical protein